MTQDKTPQERLKEEQEHKEHVHHTKINAAAIADHILGNIHTIHVKLHQYHWYVKGPHFFSLHDKLKELYNVNEEWFDKIAERLIASGHKPASTTAELEKYSMLLEDPADKYLEAEEMIENVIEDFRSTRGLTIRAIHLAREEGDDVLEDTLIAFKKYLYENIWMLQAYLGKEALEDDDDFEVDDDEE
ncbi:DNA starvation/stationary phase protection protein [Jeotgalicoccus sp. WY2]|uniref:Dps family protein n=1 Tax=Jeotgalicoccus sp. WY2 TaxID=2708346 RepID=UPI001BD6AFA4|nr:DNA starvation/stationary phase protection protein [Jeotgalicoccus sp. WY2]